MHATTELRLPQSRSSSAVHRHATTPARTTHQPHQPPTLFIDFTSLRPTVSSRIRSNPSRPGLTDYGVDGGTIYGGDEPAPNYVGDRQNGMYSTAWSCPTNFSKLMNRTD